jgi:Avidin family
MTIDRKQLSAYSATQPSGKATVPTITGTWQNELGSTMTITTFDGKNFSGSYTSAVSGGSGSVTGSLAGTLSGDAIGFTVNWSPTYSSATSWNGLVLNYGEGLAIYALWHLASTPENAADFWESILAGADLFGQTT